MNNAFTPRGSEKAYRLKQLAARKAERMRKLIPIVAGAALAAGSAIAAQQAPDGSQAAVPPQQQASAAKQVPSYYWWLHPKQGMVKVDRATNLPVVARRSKQQG